MFDVPLRSSPLSRARLSGRLEQRASFTREWHRSSRVVSPSSSSVTALLVRNAHVVSRRPLRSRRTLSKPRFGTCPRPTGSRSRAPTSAPRAGHQTPHSFVNCIHSSTRVRLKHGVHAGRGTPSHLHRRRAGCAEVRVGFARGGCRCRRETRARRPRVCRSRRVPLRRSLLRRDMMHWDRHWRRNMRRQNLRRRMRPVAKRR